MVSKRKKVNIYFLLFYIYIYYIFMFLYIFFLFFFFFFFFFFFKFYFFNNFYTIFTYFFSGKIKYKCTKEIQIFDYLQDKSNMSEYYREENRLFNFECLLEPEIKSNLRVNNNTGKFILNDKNTSDFTIIVLPLDDNDEECETINYLRNNCKIKGKKKREIKNKI